MKILTDCRACGSMSTAVNLFTQTTGAMKARALPSCGTSQGIGSTRKGKNPQYKRARVWRIKKAKGKRFQHPFPAPCLSQRMRSHIHP